MNVTVTLWADRVRAALSAIAHGAQSPAATPAQRSTRSRPVDAAPPTTAPQSLADAVVELRETRRAARRDRTFEAAITYIHEADSILMFDAPAATNEAKRRDERN